MVHHICHIINTAQVHIILTGNDRSEFPLHFLFHNSYCLRRYTAHICHAFQYRYPFFIWKLFQYLGRLLRIHISHDQSDHLGPLMLEQGKKGFGISLCKKVKWLGLESLGYFFQKISGCGFSKSFFQYTSGIIQTSICHHLVGKAHFIKLI